MFASFKIFLAKILGKTHQSFAKGDEVYPYRDWKMVLIVSLCIAVLLIAGGLYFLYQVSSDSFTSQDTNAPVSPEAISREKLKSLIQGFQDKSLEFEKLKQKPVDAPSL